MLPDIKNVLRKILLLLILIIIPPVNIILRKQEPMVVDYRRNL